ncbi:myosin IC heavy chain-like, partial [Manacus candei]|uniref:myosin IC heavy chain-like n=1 Tax=Manacus candei TaxID=415023 RepID=UPI002227FFFB
RKLVPGCGGSDRRPGPEPRPGGCSRRCAEPGPLSGDGSGERGWRWSSASGPAAEDRGGEGPAWEGNGCRRGNQEMLQPDAAARVKGGKDRREIVRKCAFIQSLQLSLSRTSPSQPRVGERGRLGCARLGTGTNSSLPCSGRFSGPVRDSPKGCKGARATSELVSRDKGANPARRGPSLRGKGVARVSPPGPACGGASPPGDGRAVPWSCALHCPSYCQGMEEMCPGAVPCTALPGLPALRSSGSPARSRRTPSTARGSRDGAAPGQRFHRQPDGFVWRAGLVCQTHIPGVGTGHGHCGGHGQRAARGSSAGGCSGRVP